MGKERTRPYTNAKGSDPGSEKSMTTMPPITQAAKVITRVMKYPPRMKGDLLNTTESRVGKAHHQ
eukprot:2548106-Heterocapsa_arctica.AAC.1